jgi:hypothetical protein
MQAQQLRRASCASSSGRPSLLLPRARPSLRARAEPPKVESTREFREDTGDVSVPQKNADGSVYVDVNAPVRVSRCFFCVDKTLSSPFSASAANDAPAQRVGCP